jgi:hypothetical protein
VKVTLSVSERFRGDSGDFLVVGTEALTVSCGYPFEAGQDYLVFASEFQGNLIVSTCSATQPAKVAMSRIRQLRALRDGTALPDLFGFVGSHADERSANPAEQAQPAPGLTVTARSENGEYRTRSADDGTYEFRGVPAGRYQVSVEAPPGRLALWGGSADHVGANAGPDLTCPVDFQVFWDGRITGRVVNRDGQPVSGFITAQYAGPEKIDAAEAGNPVQAGRFEITRLRPGRYRLLFRAEGRSQVPAFYYPGTQSESAAALVEVGEGTHVDGLQFTVF